MGLWIFVAAVTVAIVKTGYTYQIGEIENEERNIQTDGDYRKLESEMRALTEIVLGQGFTLEKMEREIENLKSKNIMMETLVKRQQINLNAQGNQIEKLKRQNSVCVLRYSSICGGREDRKDAEYHNFGETSKTPSCKGNNSLNQVNRQHMAILNTKSSDKPFSYRQGAETQSKKVMKSKRMVLGSGNTGIAFTAYLNHNLPINTTGHIVKCDAVLLNDGNAYSNHTGIFTVPTSGVYLFYFAVHAWHNNTVVQVALTVDDRAIVGAGLDLTDSEVHHDESSSNAALVRLTQGEGVWLTAHVDTTTYNGELTSDDGHRFVTFSGVYLY